MNARFPQSLLTVGLLLLAAAASAAAAPAPLAADPIAVAELPAKVPPHWLWVNDMDFVRMADGRSYLVDADEGRMRGLLNTGYSFSSIALRRDGSMIYSPETYFSRGVRGRRIDVVTLYDPVHLQPVGEVPIPAKRASAIPMAGEIMLTDDDRFLLIYNFTPAQSVTVVDTKTRKFTGEVDTAGCALAYPTGPRSFFSICGDAGLLSVKLDERGKAVAKSHSKPLFDAQKDPLTEKGVRLGHTWYFVSYGAEVYPITDEGQADEGQGPVVGKRWSLVTDAEREEGWRSGGVQHFALHGLTHRLYAIMHKGPLATHKEGGTDVWVFDLATGARLQKLSLRNVATSIQVSQDAHPLLYSAFIGSSTLDVYDAMTGAYLRSIGDLAATPTLLVTPP